MSKMSPQDWMQNRWVLEPNPAEATSLIIDPAPITWTGHDAERIARERQTKLASLGCSSQLYHERHVLIKEPIEWKPGDHTLRPR